MFALTATLFVCGALVVGPTPWAAGNVTGERVQAGHGEHWFLKGGSFRGEHYSALAKINDHNVAGLGLEWAIDLSAPDGVSATPIVVDGVIYLSAAYSLVYAVDAASGAILWKFDPDVRAAIARWPGRSWTARVNRGVAVWDGKVFVTTADCRLIALNAKSGTPAWSKKTCNLDHGYSITDSPYVGGDKVFVGNAGSESHKKTRGYVSAYDVADGRLLWRFYTVPSANPAENTTAAMKMAEKTWSGTALAEFGGGGNNWNEMTYDPDSGLLYFGTAGAIPYTHAARSPEGGDNLFLSSILALDAATGEYVWHYQTVPEDSWDYNATMNIVLADLKIGGKNRKVLMTAPKNGFHYVLDRLTGELLAADPYVKVNWANHINLETGRPVYSPQAEFWRPGDESTAVWPNVWGAHNWQPMAWHPGERLVYIPAADLPSIVSNYADGDYDDTLRIATEIDGKPFSPGKLIAWDPVSGRARWIVDHALPFNGGVLATAGNLVFQGDAQGRFVAYAADSGRELWSLATGSAISAAPVSYSVSGRQHVLIPIGAGGGMQFVYPELHADDEAKGPTRLLAFSLDGTAGLPRKPPLIRTLPKQPPLVVGAATIDSGRLLYADNCEGCHGANATARSGGSVPDLRYANSKTHTQWHGIVIGGAKQSSGMPKFELDSDESEAIRQYALSLSEQLRR